MQDELQFERTTPTKIKFNKLNMIINKQQK